jgi:hypothetical protein
MKDHGVSLVSSAARRPKLPGTTGAAKPLCASECSRRAIDIEEWQLIAPIVFP